jgi:hypothetical protein
MANPTRHESRKTICGYQLRKNFERQRLALEAGMGDHRGELTELEARGVWIFWFRELLLRCCYNADNGFVTIGLLA